MSTERKETKTAHFSDQDKTKTMKTARLSDQDKTKPLKTAQSSDLDKNKSLTPVQLPDEDKTKTLKTAQFSDQDKNKSLTPVQLPDQGKKKSLTPVQLPDQGKKKSLTPVQLPDQDKTKPLKTVQLPDQGKKKLKTAQLPDHDRKKSLKTVQLPDQDKKKSLTPVQLPDQDKTKPLKAAQLPAQDKKKLKTAQLPAQDKKKSLTPVQLPDQDKTKPLKTVQLPEQDRKKSLKTVQLPAQDKKKSLTPVQLPDQDKTKPLKTVHLPDQDRKKSLKTERLPDQDKKKSLTPVQLPDQDKTMPLKTVQLPDQDRKKSLKTVQLPDQDRKKSLKTVQLPDQDKTKPLEQVSRSTSASNEQVVRKRRATQAYVMSRLPSHRHSILVPADQLLLIPERHMEERYMEERQKRRSLMRARSSAIFTHLHHPVAAKGISSLESFRSSGDYQQPVVRPDTQPRVSVAIAGTSPQQVVPTSGGTSLHSRPSSTVVGESRARKSITRKPLDALMQAAAELYEVQSDYPAFSRSTSEMLRLPVKAGSSLFEKVDQHRKSIHFGEKLKSVAAPISEKKAVREQFIKFDPTLLPGAVFQGWAKRKAQLMEVLSHLDIWASHFREIEGRFGSATASYFRFARWLIFLNFFTILVIFSVVVMPFVVSSESASFGVTEKGKVLGGVNSSQTSVSRFLWQTINCSTTYNDAIESFLEVENVQDQLLDFVVGTGWMEETSMFYGHYRNRTFTLGGRSYDYNMGLPYILAFGLAFLVIFLLILVNSSQSVKETVMDEKEHSTVHFANSVLCGWDYCIFDDKTANNRKNILFQELKADLLEQSKRLQRQNRSQREELVLLIVRVAINFVVLCVLGGALFLIYYTTNILIHLRQETEDQVLLVMIQFLPALTITILNAIIPIIFNALVSFEDYWPSVQIKVTLMRTVFVRLSSLGVLIFSLYYTLLWPGNRNSFYCPEENRVDIKCCGNFLWLGRQTNTTQQKGVATTFVMCWETYVGQQLYKLTIVDFFAGIAVTFLVDFPRKFIYDHFKERSSIVKSFGQQEFDIPRNVLDIVYSQTLCWLGAFFAPLLPIMTNIKIFCVFFIKKLTLMKNYSPPKHVYKVSRSNSFFNFILLISFVLVAAIIGYMIGNIGPSKSCGPFRLYSVDDYVVWTALSDVIAGWPTKASQIVTFFGTSEFFVPCFIILCLLMYYYWALGQGYRRVEEILREQIRLEGTDRQFLLERVNDMIQHGNFQNLASDTRNYAGFEN